MCDEVSVSILFVHQLIHENKLAASGVRRGNVGQRGFGKGGRGGGGVVKRELSNKPFLSVYLSVCQYARKKSSFHSAELRNSSHVSAFYLLKYVHMGCFQI